VVDDETSRGAYFFENPPQSSRTAVHRDDIVNDKTVDLMNETQSIKIQRSGRSKKQDIGRSGFLVP
jgi:hypothetical protein